MSTYPERIRLDGRAYVVLGSGAGIGGQSALALSQAGARVLCVDRDEAAAKSAAEACGGDWRVADLTSGADIEAVFADAADRYRGAFSGLVDVVGVPVVGLAIEQDDEAFDRQIGLVLRHAVRAVRTAAPLLAARGGGSIILIGSLAGLRATRSLALYGAAKAALHSFAQTAALELGPQGVRVNVVSPGRIKASGTVRPSAESVARIEAAVPVGRLGRPDDIAGAVLFLASDLAAYVSGVVLPVDGGIAPVTGLPN